MKKTVTPELIEAAFNDSNWKGAFYENDTQLRPLENVFVLLKGAVIDRILQFILPAPDPTQRITDMDIRSLTSLFESRGYTVKVISEHVQYCVTLKKALKYKITWYPYLLVYADADYPGLETSASMEEIADCLDAIDAASPKVSSLIGRKYNEEAQLIKMDNIFGAAVQAFLPEGLPARPSATTTGREFSDLMKMSEGALVIALIIRSTLRIIRIRGGLPRKPSINLNAARLPRLND